MERQPRIVEYICLFCGAQGTEKVEEGELDTPDVGGGQLLRCPKCGNVVKVARSVSVPEASVVGK